MKAEAVICGAGIAGIAVAYQLTVMQGLRNVVLIDAGPALAMTSDKSTECYRNWWPDAGPAMTALSNRSIDLMRDFATQTDNGISLDRRGYLFLSAENDRTDEFIQAAQAAAEFGSGPLRRHAATLDTYPSAGTYDAQHPVNGAWITGAYSGFGIMMSMAAGELLSAHICGHTLLGYATAFAPQRFSDPDYLKSLDANTRAGQL